MRGEGRRREERRRRREGGGRKKEEGRREEGEERRRFWSGLVIREIYCMESMRFCLPRVRGWTRRYFLSFMLFL